MGVLPVEGGLRSRQMSRAGWLLVLAACGRVGFEAPAGDPTDASAGDDESLRPNRIFMSSTMAPDGDLGGLDGADAFCRQHAGAVGLEGTFVALLWTATTTPADRLVGSRGWVDVHGTVIGDTPESLVFATINPLRFDEAGGRVSPPGLAFWGGQPSSSNSCADWTSPAPTPNGLHVVSPEASFDTDIYSPCDSPNHVICAELGHDVAVAPPAQSGRLAFVTEGLFQPGGGLAAADQLCQTEARDAGHGGTFLAFLASAQGPAEARFSAQGEPWRRDDGVRLTQTADELVGATPAPIWDSFLARTARGAPTNDRAWVGNTTEHCNSWMSSTGNGTIGSTHSAERARLQLFTSVGCGSSMNLICLQQ